jgi:hypothetical protein
LAPSEDVRQRFWARIEILGPDDCWVWTGPRDPDRFGLLVEPFEGLTEAHEAAWYFVNGPLARGLWALHYCENPPCCNPKHLFASTERGPRRDGAIAEPTSRRQRRRALRAARHPASADRARRPGHVPDLGALRRFV